MFVPARECHDARATAVLEMMGRLRAIERTLPSLLAPSDDPMMQEQRRAREEHRRVMRQREAEPVWDELFDWLPDRWLLNRTRHTPNPAATAG